MPKLSGVESLVPKLNVLIKGNRLPMEANADLLSVTVSEDLDVPAMFTLNLANWNLVKNQITWVDSDLFDIGQLVEIQIGYGNNLKTLIVAEITGLEPEFSQTVSPTLVVRGYDLRHRLLRDCKTRSFAKMKDSDIANKIAGEKGLSCKVKDTSIKLEYVLQANQTDLEFLQQRARRIGYEVAVEGKSLHFRSHQNNTQKILTLNRRDDLIEFSPRLSTMSQVGQIEVHSWDVKQKKALVGKAGAGDETTTMKGATSGPKNTNRAFGKASHIIINESVLSQAEAEQIAKGQYNDMALAYIMGEGICQGNPELQVGHTIEITGLGKRFSGLYYLTSVTHIYSQNLGYRTEFSVRRNAA
ncbi:phage late control D family protein [Aerosakkonema sp. BLCC-F183]|uniref:phage late control D family protein n=1 Tax=Aerosakkonema sp. BLCC-F183 TaxID=3342834 RepID=UPI0035B9E310